jgi:hypothetical protein
MADEVSIIAEKFSASRFCQSFACTKIMNTEIPDHDTAGSVVVFAAKRPAQIEVWKPSRPPRMPRIRFDERKAAKPLIAIVLIFDLPVVSI